MTAAAQGHAALMDGVYRRQRHIYDLTRKYYLLGRDHMITNLRPPAGGSVLEIGCGTGRNLALVARRYPDAALFGIDISAEMLKSAGETLSRNGLLERARLGCADATQLARDNPFAVDRFDRVFISYAVSMIPGWREALDQAIAVLAPGGQLHVVDFGQQEGLPGWFARGLRAWLARFHVAPRGDLEQAMQSVARSAGATLEFRSLYRDYARYGVIRAPGS